MVQLTSSFGNAVVGYDTSQDSTHFINTLPTGIAPLPILDDTISCYLSSSGNDTPPSSFCGFIFSPCQTLQTFLTNRNDHNLPGLVFLVDSTRVNSTTTVPSPCPDFVLTPDPDYRTFSSPRSMTFSDTGCLLFPTSSQQRVISGIDIIQNGTSAQTLFEVHGSHLHISSSSFTSLSPTSQSITLFVLKTIPSPDSSSIALVSITFQALTFSPTSSMIILAENSEALISDCSFSTIICGSAGLLVGTECPNLVIEKTIFTDIQLTGSSLMKLSSSSVVSTLLVFDSVFTSITSTKTNGTVLSIKSLHPSSLTVLDNTNFTDCSTTGNGGAVFIHTFETNPVVFEPVSFTNVSAKKGTGGSPSVPGVFSYESGFGGCVCLVLDETSGINPLQLTFNTKASQMQESTDKVGNILFIVASQLLFRLDDLSLNSHSATSLTASSICFQDVDLNSAPDSLLSHIQNLYSAPEVFVSASNGTDTVTPVCGKLSNPCQTMAGLFTGVNAIVRASGTAYFELFIVDSVIVTASHRIPDTPIIIQSSSYSSGSTLTSDVTLTEIGSFCIEQTSSSASIEWCSLRFMITSGRTSSTPLFELANGDMTFDRCSIGSSVSSLSFQIFSCTSAELDTNTLSFSNTTFSSSVISSTDSVLILADIHVSNSQLSSTQAFFTLANASLVVLEKSSFVSLNGSSLIKVNSGVFVLDHVEFRQITTVSSLISSRSKRNEEVYIVSCNFDCCAAISNEYGVLLVNAAEDSIISIAETTFRLCHAELPVNMTGGTLLPRGGALAIIADTTTSTTPVDFNLVRVRFSICSAAIGNNIYILAKQTELIISPSTSTDLELDTPALNDFVAHSPSRSDSQMQSFEDFLMTPLTIFAPICTSTVLTASNAANCGRLGSPCYSIGVSFNRMVQEATTHLSILFLSEMNETVTFPDISVAISPQNRLQETRLHMKGTASFKLPSTNTNAFAHFSYLLIELGVYDGTQTSVFLLETNSVTFDECEFVHTSPQKTTSYSLFKTFASSVAMIHSVLSSIPLTKPLIDATGGSASFLNSTLRNLTDTSSLIKGTGSFSLTSEFSFFDSVSLNGAPLIDGTGTLSIMGSSFFSIKSTTASSCVKWTASGSPQRIDSTRFHLCTTTGADGGAVSIACPTTTTVVITRCVFDSCWTSQSSKGGALFIAAEVPSHVQFERVRMVNTSAGTGTALCVSSSDASGVVGLGQLDIAVKMNQSTPSADPSNWCVGVSGSTATSLLASTYTVDQNILVEASGSNEVDCGTSASPCASLDEAMFHLSTHLYIGASSLSFSLPTISLNGRVVVPDSLSIDNASVKGLSDTSNLVLNGNEWSDGACLMSHSYCSLSDVILIIPIALPSSVSIFAFNSSKIALLTNLVVEATTISSTIIRALSSTVHMTKCVFPPILLDEHKQTGFSFVDARLILDATDFVGSESTSMSQFQKNDDDSPPISSLLVSDPIFLDALCTFHPLLFHLVNSSSYITSLSFSQFQAGVLLVHEGTVILNRVKFDGNGYPLALTAPIPQSPATEEDTPISFSSNHEQFIADTPLPFSSHRHNALIVNASVSVFGCTDTSSTNPKNISLWITLDNSSFSSPDMEPLFPDADNPSSFKPDGSFSSESMFSPFTIPSITDVVTQTKINQTVFILRGRSFSPCACFLELTTNVTERVPFHYFPDESVMVGLVNHSALPTPEWMVELKASHGLRPSYPPTEVEEDSKGIATRNKEIDPDVFIAVTVHSPAIRSLPAVVAPALFFGGIGFIVFTALLVVCCGLCTDRIWKRRHEQVDIDNAIETSAEMQESGPVPDSASALNVFVRDVLD